MEFNPMNDQLIASASEDTTIKVWKIPEGGLTEDITTPEVDMRGHGRKVTLIKAHPTTDNILASTSSDFTVRLWDMGTGQEVVNMADVSENNLVQDLAWSAQGNFLATSCKDKVVRIYDARSGQLAMK